MTRQQNTTASAAATAPRHDRRAPRAERRGSRGQRTQAAVRESLNAHR